MHATSYSGACRVLQGLSDKDLARALIYGQSLIELRGEAGGCYRIFREAAQQATWNWPPWPTLPANVRQGIAAKWNGLQDCAAVLDLSVLGETRAVRIYLAHLAEITPTRITPEVVAHSKLSILAALRAALPYPESLLGKVLNGAFAVPEFAEVPRCNPIS